MLDSIKNKLKNSERYLLETSIKTKWLFLRRQVLKQFKHWIPRQLFIGVTYKCQCQCQHCVVGPLLNKNDGEMSTEEIYHLVRTAKNLGFIEISYFGGEPLLRGDIIKLIQFSSSQGLLTSIYSNGILLTKERAVELKKAGLYLCNISIDSSYADMHNYLRGHEGCFEKAVEGIKYLQDVGIICSIWTYVKKEDVQNNLKDLKEIIELGRKLRVNKIVILYPYAAGNWLYSTENILTEAERMKVRDFHNPPFTVLEFPNEESICKAGIRHAYISPQGDVFPCPTLNYPLGNIRRESLDTILKKTGEDFRPFLKDCCGGDCILNKDSFLGECEMKRLHK